MQLCVVCLKVSIANEGERGMAKSDVGPFEDLPRGIVTIKDGLCRVIGYYDPETGMRFGSDGAYKLIEARRKAIENILLIRGETVRVRPQNGGSRAKGGFHGTNIPQSVLK
jgi:hypothetical protein